MKIDWICPGCYSIFRVPSTVFFGPGCSEVVGEQILELGCSSVLLIVDSNVMALGVAEPVFDSMKEASVKFEIYAEPEPEPSIKSVLKPLRVLNKSDATLVVALGGGSTIDTAKAVALVGKLGGSIEDYLGIGQAIQAGFPVIAMPTTSGTGSEVTAGGQLLDTTRNIKVPFGGPCMIPRVAIVDPLLTLSAPQEVAAGTGLDALAHAIEAYTSPKATPLTEMYSLEAIRLVAKSLRKAVWNRHDVSANTHMALASLYAGIAMSNVEGGAAVHAIAYPIGARYGVPHGKSVGMVLAPVITFNTAGNIEKYADIAEALGESTTSLSKTEAAEMAGIACRKLTKHVGIDETLGQLGIDESVIGQLAEEAVSIERLMVNNPRTMTVEDAIHIYQSLM